MSDDVTKLIDDGQFYDINSPEGREILRSIDDPQEIERAKLAEEDRLAEILCQIIAAREQQRETSGQHEEGHRYLQYLCTKEEDAKRELMQFAEFWDSAAEDVMKWTILDGVIERYSRCEAQMQSICRSLWRDDA
ncbi:hypothetical protein [Bradyrhizobium sp. WYCCWR 12699]|uniref:hypothetical protein n=1 Tax=Bradyrhizobium sp. WYCCWR 12699 TaxID=3064203 RepID=UPI0028A4A449|nr:hypothetical protein [Bradyrhizobium sp. WYCCWR 12699]MDT4739257.1 hypothetical protein [Bradyrhizobium sp. WYCCWR 12699]